MKRKTIMPFGQLVIGPPGSGKTTYCNGLHQYLNASGRKTIIVNLDPANDVLPYDCAINVANLITLEDAMEAYGLGPNGGIMYCIEYIEKNLDWLQTELKKYEDCYVLFDCPGQVELYTHHDSMKNIIRIIGKWDYRLCAVHLVDSHHCTDVGKYIAALLLSLKTMIHLELPHVNVLSKIDLLSGYGKLAFNLDFYTEVQDLSYLLEKLITDPFFSKFRSFNEALIGLIEDYSLVNFQTLCITDPASVVNLQRLIDKANGYIYGGLTLGNESIFSTAVKAGKYGEDVADVQGKYLDYPEIWTEWERLQSESSNHVARQDKPTEVQSSVVKPSVDMSVKLNVNNIVERDSE
ncbi:hypothetical protein BKA69DRAFT_1137205 [Paraphysoderma sedebokerense]|nr:hypothetical protein BKA69DRAFT_1137205 [Paraphysoderma sedebokerense]